jgi:transcriptional regulator with XRE-family HTH domain
MVTGIFSTVVDAYKTRLAAAMKLAGVNDAALAKHLGVTLQAVRKVLKGDSAALNAPNNAKAARFLGVTSDWLALGADTGMQLQLTDAERAMVQAVRERLRKADPPTPDELDGRRQAMELTPRLVRPTRRTTTTKKKGTR